MSRLFVLDSFNHLQIGGGVFNTFEELWLVFFHESFDPEHAGENHDLVFAVLGFIGNCDQIDLSSQAKKQGLNDRQRP